MIAFAIRDPLGILAVVPPSQVKIKGSSPLFKSTVVPTRDEELRLIKKAQSGSIDARNELIDRNLPFVLSAARIHYRVRGKPRHLEYDDLVQACFFGMVRAIEKYDPKKSTGRFIAYAKHWVRHMMDDEIHYSKSYRVPRSVQYQYDRNKLKIDKTRLAVERFCEMSFLPEGYDVHGSETRDSLIAKEEIGVLKRALSKLSPDNLALLKERYVEGLTLREMGDKRNRTKERVRQLLKKIEDDLRESCAEYTSA